MNKRNFCGKSQNTPATTIDYLYKITYGILMFRLTAINKEHKKNELKEIASFPIGSFFFMPPPLFSFFDFVSASLISFVFEIEHRISQKNKTIVQFKSICTNKYGRSRNTIGKRMSISICAPHLGATRVTRPTS